MQATPHRDWRLDQALRACQAAPALSGEELEVIIGHIRPAPCCIEESWVLRHSCVFVQMHVNRRRRLWPSVLHELELFRCLITRAFFRIGMARATDACPSGYAVCESDWSATEAAEVGQEDERCVARGLGHRSQVARHVLEARRVPGAVKHRCRDAQKHGKCITVSNDNLQVVLAVQSPTLGYFVSYVIFLLIVWQLGSACMLDSRWVPSERNLADRPSRQWERSSSTPLPSGEREAVKSSWQEGGGQANKEGSREVQSMFASSPRT